MLKEIARPELLQHHAQQLQKKNFKPGFDGMKPQALSVWLELHAQKLCGQLRRGTYEPMPALGFRTAKFDGTYRQLAKLTALDMTVQNAMLSAMMPACGELLPPNICAYLPGRGVRCAVEQFCALGSANPFAAVLDPAACFVNLDHTVLENLLQTLFPDREVVGLIMKYVRMPVMADKQLTYPQRGVLQGEPLSNLLCNLYFVPLDRYLLQQGIPFIRYADDIVLFASTREEAAQRYSDAAAFLKNELKLKENKKKAKVCRSVDMTYLGVRFEQTRDGIGAVGEAAEADAVCKNWQSCTPADSHRCVDILSDGILRQKDMSIAFETVERIQSLPVKATEVINVYSSVIFDSHFLQRAMENRITVNVFDRHDKLIGRFIPNAPLHTPCIPHRQLLEYYDAEARMELARSFVLAAVHHSKLNIRYYARHRESEVLSDALKGISELEKQIKRCGVYEELLLLDARAKEQYYRCFEIFLAGTPFRFEKRSKRPPHNEMNAMISCGNTVLYNDIATRIAQTPLDDRIGYLHATNRRPESLNLDVAESYRPLIVDRVVFSMVNLKRMQPADFIRTDSGGVYLTDNGKRKFLRAFYEKLDAKLTVNGESCSYRRIITEDIRSLVRHFRSGESYQSFKQVK
jgi:CRISPR-associated endonuclease Cas1 subtype I-B